MAKRRRSGDGAGEAQARGIVLALVVVVGVYAALWGWTEVRRRAERVGSPVMVPPVARVRVEPPTPAVPPVAPALSADMELGNPSGANAGDRDNYLMVKPWFAVSYNNSMGRPNWVSWRLTKGDLGHAKRKQVFDPDETLPVGFTRITHKDYSGSGFDRGHLCPHGDRERTEEASFATFVMTNVVPQAPNVNQRAWADLEDYCRELVKRGGVRLYICAGGIGRGGRGSLGTKETVGGGKVVVPAECWKVIVVVREGEDPSLRVAQTSASGDAVGEGVRVIAVVMPNDQALVGSGWGKWRVSVGEVERRTGYRFFDRVNPGVAERWKAGVDTGPQG